MKEYHVNAVGVTSRNFHPDQQGRQKPNRFCINCRKNGHTLNWCRKKMRDEEVRNVRLDKFPKMKNTRIQNFPISNSNHIPENVQTMNHFPDLDDRDFSTNERLSNEVTWQHEADQLTPRGTRHEL